MTTPKTDSLLLTASEVAALLRIGRSSVYALKDAGELPYMAIGASVRFRRAAIERYIEQAERRKAPVTPIVNRTSSAFAETILCPTRAGARDVPANKKSRSR